jgi:oligopeptide transport system substrate-binding protein
MSATSSRRGPRQRHATASRASSWALLLGALLSALLAAPLQAGGVLRGGHPGEPDSLDPHAAIAAPALIVNNDLFEALMTLDARGRPVLGAAERYSVSPDGRVYTFVLRPGLVWSDGRPITSADFLYSFRRLANPATGLTGLAAWIDLIQGGKAILQGKAPPDSLGVSAPDPRSVRIELVAPAPYFPNIVSLPVFAPMPRHVIEQHGRAWTRPGNIVSNGPFMLQEWRPGQFVRVRRNPRFHAAQQVRLDGVEYHPIADLNAGLRLFRAGQLDTLTNFPPEKLDSLRAEMPGELRLAPSLGVTVYVLNHRSPKLADPRVRRALSLAIDRELITARLVRAGDTPALGLVPPGMAPRGTRPRTPAVPSPAQRVAQARELLTASGYGKERPLELELLYHTSEEHKKVAVAVAAMWQAIGVRTQLRNAERQVVEVATRKGEFEVVRAAWFSAYPDPLGFMTNLRQGSPANSGAYGNPRFEALLAEASRAADAGRRADLLAQAESVLIEDQAVLPLYFIVSRRLVSRRVVGWQDDNLSALRPARWLDLR